MENPNSLKEAMALADLRIKKGYWKTVLLRSLRAVIKRTTEPFVSIHDRYGINASRDTNFALTKYDQMAGEYRKKVKEGKLNQQYGDEKLDDTKSTTTSKGYEHLRKRKRLKGSI